MLQIGVGAEGESLLPAAAGIEFVASLAIPDSASSFQIKITITANGKKKMQVFG